MQPPQSFNSINQQPLIINSTRKNLSYQLVNEIGQGSEGTVYKGIIIGSGEIVAIKMQRKLKQQEQEATECFSKKQFKHIVNIKDLIYFQDQVMVVMDFADGELFQYFQDNEYKNRSQDDKNRLFLQVELIIWQIVEGVEELHNENLFHRDLKPENVVYFKQQSQQIILKLCDSGLLKKTQDSLKTPMVGTPYYQAPEQLTSNNYTNKIDIWALGMIWYEMINGKTMLTADTVDNLQNIIENLDTQKIESLINSSDMFILAEKQILKTILQIDPFKRPTAAGLKQLLSFLLNKKPCFIASIIYTTKSIVTNLLKPLNFLFGPEILSLHFEKWKQHLVALNLTISHFNNSEKHQIFYTLIAQQCQQIQFVFEPQKVQQQIQYQPMLAQFKIDGIQQNGRIDQNFLQENYILQVKQQLTSQFELELSEKTKEIENFKQQQQYLEQQISALRFQQSQASETLIANRISEFEKKKKKNQMKNSNIEQVKAKEYHQKLDLEIQNWKIQLAQENNEKLQQTEMRKEQELNQKFQQLIIEKTKDIEQVKAKEYHQKLGLQIQQWQIQLAEESNEKIREIESRKEQELSNQKFKHLQIINTKYIELLNATKLNQKQKLLIETLNNEIKSQKKQRINEIYEEQKFKRHLNRKLQLSLLQAKQLQNASEVFEQLFNDQLFLNELNNSSLFKVKYLKLQQFLKITNIQIEQGKYLLQKIKYSEDQY